MNPPIPSVRSNAEMAPIPVFNGHGAPEGAAVVVYSADHDLRESLEMLLQDRYKVITVGDAGRMMAESVTAGILIADVEPGTKVGEMFRSLKTTNSCLRIILFYAPRFHDRPLDIEFRKTIDAVMFKPIDLDTFTEQLSVMANHH